MKNFFIFVHKFDLRYFLFSLITNNNLTLKRITYNYSLTTTTCLRPLLSHHYFTYNLSISMTTCVTQVYPPGVLQTVTIPDPTSLDGLGDLEITLIPSKGVTDINHFSEKGIQHFKEMLYEIDEEHRKNCEIQMGSVARDIEDLKEREQCIWDDNAYAIDEDFSRRQPSLWFTLNSEPVLPAPWSIRIALDQAEEDFDYEEWINSKQYVKSLQEYNLHKLLAWDKGSEGEHPKWSGEYKELTQRGNFGRFSDLYNSYIKERYRVEVDVHTLNWGKGGSFYAYGSTPYGDVYIPEKIANHLKDVCGLYEMDIALQDVEGAPGKKPNSFRWTCIYLHNKGFSLE